MFNVVICLIKPLFDLVTIWWLIWFGVYCRVYLPKKRFGRELFGMNSPAPLPNLIFIMTTTYYIYIKSSLIHSYLYHLSHADHLSSLAHASVDKVRLLFGLQFCSYLLLLIASVTNNYHAL